MEFYKVNEEQTDDNRRASLENQPYPTLDHINDAWKQAEEMTLLLKHIHRMVLEQTTLLLATNRV